MEISFFENIDKIWKLKSHLLRDLRCKGENWCLGSTIKKKKDVWVLQGLSMIL